MRIWGLRLGFNPAALLAGVGAILVTSSAINRAPKLLRSAAKTIIKAGYFISDKLRIVYWEQKPSIVVGGARRAHSAEPAADAFVYVSSKGKKYHRKNCKAALQAQQMLSPAEAIAGGYGPCRVCRAAPQNVPASTAAS